MAKKQKPRLSELESNVMDVVWAQGSATADSVRIDLSKTQQLKDSTVRTVLRRLEEKGYVEHEVDGRTYVYRPCVQSQNVAVDAVRGIIERFCAGSVENLLVGMVDDKIMTADKLQKLAQKIADAELKEKKGKRKS